jgi:uncharacterized membrane protein
MPIESIKASILEIISKNFQRWINTSILVITGTTLVCVSESLGVLGRRVDTFIHYLAWTPDFHYIILGRKIIPLYTQKLYQTGKFRPPLPR